MTPTALILAMSAKSPRLEVVPRSMLAAETLGLVRFIRSGVGLFVAALVGVWVGFAMQADMNPGALRRTQTLEMFGLVLLLLSFLGLSLMVARVSLKLYLAGAPARSRALRRLLFKALATGGTPRDAVRWSRHPYVRRWNALLSDGFTLVAATAAAPLALGYLIVAGAQLTDVVLGSK